MMILIPNLITFLTLNFNICKVFMTHLNYISNSKYYMFRHYCYNTSF